MGNMKEHQLYMARNSAFNPYRLRDHEMGYQTTIGSGDAIAKSLYCGIKPVASWEADRTKTPPTGGIFNLEFSPDGSLLVAACEKKSIQIFDPLNREKIHTVVGSHADCVNCVKFLDGRMFATCSDDTTIALWDVRNLKKKIRTLLGHSKWVKNIEFSVKDKLLVTSGLDGSIYTWDINSYTEYNLIYQRVFHTSSLMRCRLSPDSKQMIMCTTGGLIIIIHDLNLNTLSQDLHGFKPNLYRLMQMSRQPIPIAAMYDHLFDSSRKENRVEFISDFPDGNDAEVVSSLQVHPQGWSALSRNISHDDKSEWTCIHDIQTIPDVSDKSTRDTSPSGGGTTHPGTRPVRRRPRYYRTNRMHHINPMTMTHVNLTMDGDVVGPGPSSSRNAPANPSSVQPSRLSGNDLWEAAITVKQQRILQEMYQRGQVRRNFNMQRITGINSGINPAIPVARPVLNRRLGDGEPPRSITPSTSGQTPPRDPEPSDTHSKNNIRQNKERLLYFKEETNEGRGFIKELCFSSDGRIVCSPFGRGMRLLALNEDCSELPYTVQGVTAPTQLTEIGQSLGIHQDLVVSTKFSPRYHMLVTGCLEGKIVWYQPFSGEF
ncbi:DDB1- and CUL4-associated factor 10 isoform X2 [Spodoptera frugiperda]|uniref:DDB1- and CUL4-associated factor 10 isoform X2 n=1 Tax=Spodoptera frugiperda TaxID=7108 RepID=A0A9R0DQ05_SPOFR|nr:DDB1- and CUL4-associated factor 10 isoform X2 [Spodoptera frugiperda]